MINGVSSSSSSSFAQTSVVQSSNSQNSTLSSYQKEYIGALLENYDSSSLSADDATQIVSALKDQGISASEELAKYMNDAGFSAKEIGDLASAAGGIEGGGKPAGGPPPPPPPQAGNQSSQEDEDYISELLDSLLSTDDQDEDASTTTSSVVNGVSFSDVMDYTSRIVNLNEQSQEQVMTLLDGLNSEDNQLSNTQKASLVKQNLGDILSNQDNYNRVSFYA